MSSDKHRKRDRAYNLLRWASKTTGLREPHNLAVLRGKGKLSLKNSDLVYALERGWIVISRVRYGKRHRVTCIEKVE